MEATQGGIGVPDYKYRLACIIDDQCVLRYDNEAGKGDHRHFGKVETSKPRMPT